MSSTNGTANGTPAAKKKFLRNPTGAYRPGGAWWGYPSAVLDGQPWFTWLDVPRMLRDPQVRFVERMWRAPFQRVKWRVRADSPRVARFVGHTLRRFWRNSLPKILSRYFRYGYGPGGAEFACRKGLVRLDRVRAVEPRDARPLVWAAGRGRGKPAGFTLGANGGSPYAPPDDRPGAVWVSAPHAFWFAGYGEYSPWFDCPPIAGMFEPWVEKRGRNGAVHSRRLWYRKCAYSGGTLYHPDGTTNVGSDESPQYRNNQDLARELLDYAEAGDTKTFFNDKHPDGQGGYAWDYHPPEGRPDVAGVREYPQDLDREMLVGAGIPPEVLEAAEVGSGWSGRLIPLMGFLGGVDELAGLVIEAADVGWMRHLVRVNFGRAWYEVEPQSLAEEVQQQAKGGKGGTEGPNPLADLFGGKPPAEGPRKMSWAAYEGPHGGKGWQDTETGEVRYQEDSPDGGDGGPAAHADSKARRIVRALADLPKRAVRKARDKVRDTYAKLEQRYGPRYARVIVGAGVAGLPVPLPGASVMMAAPVLAVAELHRRLAKWGSPPPEQVDQEGVVKPAARWFLSRVFGRLRGAINLSAFDPDSGLRLGKRRLIHLVALAMLKVQEEATAAGKPGDAAADLEHLAGLADDPDAVAEILGGTELSWTKYEGPKGGTGWQNTETGRVIYTKGDRPGEKKEKREASENAGRDLLQKVIARTAAAEDLIELTTHLPAVRIGVLKNARAMLDASFRGGRRKQQMVDALIHHVRGRILDERLKEQGITGAAADEMRAAAAESDEPPAKPSPADRIESELTDRDKKELEAGPRPVPVPPAPPLPGKDREPTLEQLEGGPGPGTNARTRRRADPHSPAPSGKLPDPGTLPPPKPGENDPASGPPAPPVPRPAAEKPKPKPKSKSVSDTVYAAVRRYGGIDPASLAFRASYADVAEAREDGIPLGVFRTGGRGLDDLAEELQTAGLITIPDDVHPAQHLLDLIREGAHTHAADLSARYEKALYEHYRLLQAEADAADRPAVEEALRLGEEAGRAEGAEGARGADGGDAGPRGGEEPGDAAEPDGDVDTSFDIGAFAPPPAYTPPSDAGALARELHTTYRSLPPSQGSPPVPGREQLGALIDRAAAVGRPLAEAVSSFLRGGRGYSYRMFHVARELVDKHELAKERAGAGSAPPPPPVSPPPPPAPPPTPEPTVAEKAKGAVRKYREKFGTPATADQPKPKKKSGPVATGTLAGGGTVMFVPHPSVRHGGDALTTVVLDPKKVDAEWSHDEGYYIPSGGGGAEVAGRRGRFEKFLAGGKPVEAPRLVIGANGRMNFEDGRHRFRVLADGGIDRIAATVPVGQAEEFRRRFGASTPVEGTGPKGSSGSVESSEKTLADLKAGDHQTYGAAYRAALAAGKSGPEADREAEAEAEAAIDRAITGLRADHTPAEIHELARRIHGPKIGRASDNPKSVERSLALIRGEITAVRRLIQSQHV